jgi:endogenous inhibitor of DNA gyrase (YacG/DUF329 family)
MTCPICAETTETQYRPFCSKKCADIDLGRWFNGTYTTPAEDAEEIGEAQSELEKPKSLPH